MLECGLYVISELLQISVGGSGAGENIVREESSLFWFFLGKYLVDPASSHMLVSKTKPCMSQYIPNNGETANGSLQQL